MKLNKDRVHEARGGFGSKTRISAERAEIAAARLGYLATGQKEMLGQLPLGNTTRQDPISLTPTQAEVIVVGNIGLLAAVGMPLAGSEGFQKVRDTVETGLAALQEAAGIEEIIFRD